MGFVCLKYFLLSLHKAVLSVKDIASADECYGGGKGLKLGNFDTNCFQPTQVSAH